MSDDKPALTITEMTALYNAANRSPNIPDRFAALEARVERLERAIALMASFIHPPSEPSAEQDEARLLLYRIRKDLAESEKDGAR